MPRINIYESDNTGSTATDLATIFVPGPVELKSGLADANGCVVIPSGTNDLSKYFDDSDYNAEYEDGGTTYAFMNTVHMIDELTKLGYAVIYKYMDTGSNDSGSSSSGDTDGTYVAIAENTFTEKNYKILLASHIFYTRAEKNGKYTYKAVSKKSTYDDCVEVYLSGEYYYILVADSGSSVLAETDWSFLRDKNAYDMKFITTGVYGTVPVGKITDITSDSVTYYLQIVDKNVTADNFDDINATTPLYILSGGRFVAVTEFDSSATYYIQSTTVRDNYSDSSVVKENEQGTQVYTFDFTVANKILPICGERKDCSLLVDLNYYDILNGTWGTSGDVDTSTEDKITYTVKVTNGIDINGDELAGDWKTALEYDDGDSASTLTKTASDSLGEKIDLSSRGYSLISNATLTYTYNEVTYTLTVPASFVYLYQYATVNNAGRNWRPLAGVQRGVIDGVFTPDLNITKYYVDNSIISDGAGVSFNAILNVRPYGYTIWGDRTLIEQTAAKGVQATSYFSLRNLISDIAKEAYASAISYTYETNSDITWMNFKNPITQLLDKMMSSGVIVDYKIGRRNTEQRNKMICVITLYPALPLEDIDVFINLENAEITVSEA